MDPCTVEQLERYSNQLAVAVKGLRDRLGQSDAADVNSKSVTDAAKAKASILASVEGIRGLLDGPDEFLQRLTIQVESLACLKWLAEFQILECIPQEGSLPIGDLSDLARVPEAQLRRIIRLTASAGFLQETKPNFVAHTTMSAQFLASQSLSDAIVFITATATPSALQMADATRLASTSTHRDATRKNATAYDLALHPTRPFRAACQKGSKLGRQWQAFLAHAARSHSEDELVDIFSRLNWSSLGNACIVEASRRLKQANPAKPMERTDTLMQQDGDKDLHNQSGSDSDSPDSGRIKVAFHEAGMPQPVTGAAVYILHLPPAPGSLPDSQIETLARARDLTMLQLADVGEMEMTELRQIVEMVTDEAGQLVVANELRSHNGLILALALKYVQYGW
ncbi:toxin biosynthesis regulatory protein [Corynascus similis CBS 632.67]